MQIGRNKHIYLAKNERRGNYVKYSKEEAIGIVWRISKHSYGWRIVSGSRRFVSSAKGLTQGTASTFLAATTCVYASYRNLDIVGVVMPTPRPVKERVAENYHKQAANHPFGFGDYMAAVDPLGFNLTAEGVIAGIVDVIRTNIKSGKSSVAKEANEGTVIDGEVAVVTPTPLRIQQLKKRGSATDSLVLLLDADNDGFKVTEWPVKPSGEHRGCPLCEMGIPLSAGQNVTDTTLLDLSIEMSRNYDPGMKIADDDNG